MSILTIAILNAVLATALIAGLTTVMRLPLAAGRRELAAPLPPAA